MSVKIKDATGHEVEHFTAEEVEEKIKNAKKEQEDSFKDNLTKAQEQAIEEYKKNNPDQKEEIEKLQSELSATKSELDKLKNLNDDPNMPEGQKTRLLTRIADLEKKIEDETKTSREQIEKLSKDKFGEEKGSYLSRLSGNDTELSKKIEYYFDNFMPEKTSSEDVRVRMEAAFKLATGGDPKPGLLDGTTSASPRGEGNPEFGKRNTEAKQPTQNEIAQGKVLGISEEDRKKFGEVDATKMSSPVIN